MKRTVIFILVVFVISNLCAQQKQSFSFGTDLGVGIPMSDPSRTPFEWQVSANYHFTGKWSAGIGSGISFYEKMLVPVYGKVNYVITDKPKFKPYLTCAVGYSFAPQKNSNGGFYLSPAVGVLYPVNPKVKLKLSLGYELQELERLKTHTDNYITTEFEEQLSHHSLVIRFGIIL